MDVKIKIDCRETEILKQFQCYGDSFAIERVQLPLGDIVIEYGDGTRSLVIERKTIQDLFASIKDGRYKEQKYRMLQEYGRAQVLYVIEGKWCDIDNEIIKSAIINTMIRDDIKIFITQSVAETASFVADIAKRVKRYDIEKDITQTNYASLVKDKTNTKSQYITPENFQVIALCQIPRVSANIGQVIIDHYGGLAETIANATVKEIAELRQGNRRIGDKLAERIVSFLRGNKI